MKTWLLMAFGIFALSVSAQAKTLAKVAIVAAGSPCTGGPVECTSVAQSGTIVVTDRTGNEQQFSIDPSGYTVISLEPGNYEFSLQRRSFGAPASVSKTIIGLGSGLNFVELSFDTGMR